jgi:hypothetical protein
MEPQRDCLTNMKAARPPCQRGRGRSTSGRSAGLQVNRECSKLSLPSLARAALAQTLSAGRKAFRTGPTSAGDCLLRVVKPVAGRFSTAFELPLNRDNEVHTVVAGDGQKGGAHWVWSQLGLAARCRACASSKRLNHRQRGAATQ